MRRFAPPAPLLAAGLALALGIGCGRGDDVPTPGEAPPAVFGRQPAEKGPGPWTATHILIAARNPKMLEVERSKIQAEDAARVVMKKLEAGTKFDELVAVYTDDKASIGPNRPGRIDGQYEFPAGRDGPRLRAGGARDAGRQDPSGAGRDAVRLPHHPPRQVGAPRGGPVIVRGVIA